ncbi:MAG: 4a-hydroxytetrahydrobiopterin dehydratase [Gammaproteobacteria bacterium]|nr:4a-hydroxytetrahydrobiopterin dehydratase [Gammaproteobacteria bacterium]
MADAQDLASQKCEPCSGDSPPVPETEWPTLLEGLAGWEVRKENDVPMLTRVYRRKNFLQALDLANQVGELAEAENHHPRLIVEYGRLTVSWWTHAIGGLHRNDFIMAARTDGLA